jgi:hypothetical protein
MKVSQKLCVVMRNLSRIHPSFPFQVRDHFLFRDVGHEVRILVVRHHYRNPSDPGVDRSMAELEECCLE